MTGVVPRRLGVAVALTAAALAAAVPAGGRDGSIHGPVSKPVGAPAVEPFPAAIGGPFSLIDHRGRRVSDRDFRGRYLLVFFGYVNCRGICPVGLRTMTDATDLLGQRAERVQPVLITVDPEYDTPEVLAAQVPKIHPRLIGLTGTPNALAEVRRAYKVDARPLARSREGTTIFSHGTFVYLMGPDGALLAVLPPIMDSKTMAETIGRYLE